MSLGVGEALVSFLDEQGLPSIVEKTKILAPQSKEGPADPNQMTHYITSSPLDETYRSTIDRESAFEIISEVQNEAQKQKEQEEKLYRETYIRLKAEAQARKDFGFDNTANDVVVDKDDDTPQDKPDAQKIDNRFPNKPTA